MNVQFMDLNRIHNPIRGEINEALTKVIDKNSYILGEEVSNFEANFARYCGVKYGAGVSNGTDALELALRAFGIGEGDEVITAPNSFIATASAISSSGATPVFIDVNSRDANIDPNKIEKKINEKTKAIIPVHLYGNPARINSILKIAKKYNLKLIEDACQAHGALYNQKRIGSFGDAAAFSFYPGKNLGAFGDGGIVISDNKEFIDEIKMLRNYGQSRKYHHDFFAFNKRLDGLQAAVLNVKLPYLDKWNEQRREVAKEYVKNLQDIIETPKIPPESTPVFHLYVIRAKSEVQRNKLTNFLSEKNIQTGMHYPVPIHLQKAYFELGIKEGSYPISEDICKRGLSLPIFPGMNKEEVNYVCDNIKKFHQNAI